MIIVHVEYHTPYDKTCIVYYPAGLESGEDIARHVLNVLQDAGYAGRTEPENKDTHT